MAEFTHIDLRAARDSRIWPRWKLAAELGVSEDTLERWETGKQRPEPDDVGNIERVLGIPGLWHKWMMSSYDSYRERHGEVQPVEHLTAVIVQMKHEIGDVLPLLDAVERDALDGKIDNPALLKTFRTELLEAMAAIQQTLERLPEE